MRLVTTRDGKTGRRRNDGAVRGGAKIYAPPRTVSFGASGLEPLAELPELMEERSWLIWGYSNSLWLRPCSG
jgi:hypothetical protein